MRLAGSGQRAAGSRDATGKVLLPAARRPLPAFSRGFTIAEMVTVVAIIAILAATALPVARFSLRRQKEVELHDRLRKITDAIDRSVWLEVTYARANSITASQPAARSCVSANSVTGGESTRIRSKCFASSLILAAQRDEWI